MKQMVGFLYTDRIIRCRNCNVLYVESMPGVDYDKDSRCTNIKTSATSAREITLKMYPIYNVNS